jgi:YfiH family protein
MTGDAQVLRSRVLAEIGVPHAFSTRVGGVSVGVFASLNLGNPSDLRAEDRDPPGNIRENYARVLEAAGCPGRALVEVHQVHGAAVHIVRRDGFAHAGPSDIRADAIVSDDPSRVLAIRVADCTPVLLASGDGRVVGAVHAGWRGVVAGVLPAAVRAMRSLGAAEIRGAVGPCIGVEHFEVGPEVAAEFESSFGADAASIVRPGRGDRSMVDLQGALVRQGAAIGVEFEPLRRCTFAEPELFYSHRRDRGVTGRMAGVIGARATRP